MKSPSEQYTRFEGRLVTISSNEGHWCGNLREVDLANGVYVLDKVPRYEPSKGVIFQDDFVVPIAGTRITPVTEEEREAIASEFKISLQFLNSFVQLGDSFGKLAEIGYFQYILKPSLVNVAGKYHWEIERPTMVARISVQKIIPVREEDLEALVNMQKSGS